MLENRGFRPRSARATAPSHDALGFGRRSNVSPSTATMPERRPVAEYPLEVVQKAPVEVPPDVDPRIETVSDAAQRPAHVVDPDVVVVCSDAVFGDVHRKPRLVPCPTNGALEGFGPDLVSHLGGGHPFLAAQRAVGPDPHPGIGLDPDEVVSLGRLEEHVLGGAPDPLEPVLPARLELVVGHRQGQPHRKIARARPDGLDGLAVGSGQGVVDGTAPGPVPHPGREDPEPPPHRGHHVRLIEGRGHADQVADVSGGPLAEPGETVSGLGGLPGAGGGQPSGVGEVVEGDHRHDPSLVTCSRHAPVVVERHAGELTLLGLDPAPLKREPVGAEPETSDQCDVLVEPVERIAGVSAHVDTT